MKWHYILYAILLYRGQNKLLPLSGIDEQLVFLLSSSPSSPVHLARVSSENSAQETAAGLEDAQEKRVVAAVSRIPHDYTRRPEISQILAYQRVMEELQHSPQVRGIIPMRLGSLFSEKAAIAALLQEKGERYLSLLLTLEGCVEMGLKVLLPEAETEKQLPLLKKPSGRDYLEGRRARYGLSRLAISEMKRTEGQCREFFSGLFRQYRKEEPSMETPNIYALYFLVEKKDVIRFREAFKGLTEINGEKHFLSGPWPPYNFVCN